MALFELHVIHRSDGFKRFVPLPNLLVAIVLWFETFLWRALFLPPIFLVSPMAVLLLATSRTHHPIATRSTVQPLQ
jgi:hypothetical protein